MTEQNLEALKGRLEDFAAQVIDRSSLDLKAEAAVIDAATVEVAFEGFDLPLLLGHNAELLDALQYLARRVFATEEELLEPGTDAATDCSTKWLASCTVE